MPKLACCFPNCGELPCDYPCDPPPVVPGDILLYFTPLENYVGPPSCGFDINIDIRANGMPMIRSGANCAGDYVHCPNVAPNISGTVTFLCLYGSATANQERQWSAWTCPTAGYPYSACTAPAAGGTAEYGGPTYIGYCNPGVCPTVTPCTCPPAIMTSITGGELEEVAVNDPAGTWYDPQPWTDAIEIVRNCCWDPPPGYPWLTITDGGDLLGIGDQNPTPPPAGHRCYVVTQSASSQTIAAFLQTTLGPSYVVRSMTNIVYWAGDFYAEALTGSCAGKLMSSADPCGCKGRYLCDEWRVNYLDDCRAVIQCRHSTALRLGGFGWSMKNLVQEIEFPIGSGNYICRCLGTSIGVGGGVIGTNAIVLKYGNTITPSMFTIDYDFALAPNYCTVAPYNCTWCTMGGSLPTLS